MLDDTCKAVGVCGLTDIDYLVGKAEFSLYVAPSMQGKGLGKKGLKALFNLGFQVFNLNLIWGETFDKNPAYKMFLDLGMVYDGTRRQFYYKDGKYIDAHLISITKEEFNSWNKSS
jgi:RimJ/RimL family protein N-acetyltransferase